MKYTQGPWMAEDEKIYTKEKTHIINGHDTGMRIRIGTANIGEGITMGETIANAQIMAAAPEMLDKLKEAVPYIEMADDQLDGGEGGCIRSLYEEIVALLESIEGEGVQLKPCPFCGGEAIVDYCDDDEWYVSCNGDACDIRPQTEFCETRMEAIKTWNKRVNDE